MRASAIALAVGAVVAGCGGSSGPIPVAPQQAKLAGSSETVRVPGPGEVVVIMRGFRHDKGEALVALYRDKRAFPRNNSRAHARKGSTIKNRRAVVVFQNVPPGPFAVAMLHDEDGNKKMKSGFLGKPKEGFGISRNPSIGFSPPSWSESAMVLELGKGALVEIKLRYM